MILFAFTTLLGNFYYVENSFAYILGNENIAADPHCRYSGAGMQIDLAWGVADISQCILAFINIPVCVITGGAAYRALRDYCRQRKAGVNPVYYAGENGITCETDYWK